MSGLADQVRAERLPSRSLARAIRVDAGVSQRRMALELGVHPVTLARWELGVMRPRGARRLAYATLLSELRGL